MRANDQQQPFYRPSPEARGKLDPLIIPDSVLEQARRERSQTQHPAPQQKPPRAKRRQNGRQGGLGI